MSQADLAVSSGAKTLVRLDGLADGQSQVTAGNLAALAKSWQGASRPILIALGRTDAKALKGHLALDATADAVAAVCAVAEDAKVPAISVLDGVIAGDAAVIALASHGRIASARCRLVFDQVRVGALPAEGSVCRLTRLVGAEQALQILSGGRMVTATEALAMGLVDHVVDTDHEPLGPAADRLANQLIESGEALPATQRDRALRDGRGHLAAVAEFRAKGFSDKPYQRCLADVVEACLLLPGEQGLYYETSRSEGLAQRAECRALAHLMKAEDAAGTIPEALKTIPTKNIEAFGVWGTIPAQSGPIMLNALSRGMSVVLGDEDKMRLVAQLKDVAARQELSVQDGHMSAEQRDAEWSRLTPTLNAEELAHLPLVLLGPEAELPQVLRPGPYLPDQEIRTVLVVGRQDLPSGAYRLVQSRRVSELALPNGAGAQTAAQAISFLRQMGMIVVLTGPQAPGGISGRLAAAGTMAVRSLATMGVDGAAIVAALKDAGLPAPRNVEPVPHATPKEMPAAEIVARWMAALANEGVRQLAAGLARSTGDVDLVAVHALGIPRHLGGPMHYSDEKGVLIMRRDLSEWAADGAVWSPHPSWDAFVSLGRMNAGPVLA